MTNRSGTDERSGPPLAETATVPQPELPGESQALRVVEILDEYMAGLQAGQPPDRQALLAKHPELAEPLQACLAGLEFIHACGDDTVSPQNLGDFKILREVGRGGMGAVYEARQISLGRRVALKILRFGGVSDPEAVHRFQREAETVASLHHTNIVPIFAVGSQQGVNYYAMQFIDGQSLDHVLKTHARDGKPIDAVTVADWGLQAAEALAHAHARGVIHRDVKPSNLLLDAAEGRIWLTDFGLAKRLDDVTLSLTGALLGTPRYMSPEQASASHHQLDHRTDIYSLGASLYELATGTPVFSGRTPHDVILQILTAQPRSAHSQCPTLPRDLDTILMKCLSKDATQRYDSAKKLAEDLRAFQEGRPIAARRAGPLERASRWFKRQRRSVALTAIAVAATLAVVCVTLAGSYAWQRSKLATMMLRTKHPPLIVQWFQDGHPVLPPITVPTQQRLEIPAGTYQLRVAGSGRLSQTMEVTLDAGQAFEQNLDLENQLLWKDVQVEGSFRLAAGFQDGTANVDVISLDDIGVRCLNGVDARSRWELSLTTPQHALLSEGVQLQWPWDRFHGGHHSTGLALYDSRPWLVSTGSTAAILAIDDGQTLPQSSTSPAQSCFDFNNDGQSDLLLAARHQAWVLAIDGKEGVPLWIAARADAADRQAKQTGELQSAMLQPPQVVGDQNEDNIPDVLVSCLHRQPHGVERWVELISGGTGQSIWRYDFPSAGFSLAAGEQVPEAMQWFYAGGGGHSGGSVDQRDYYRIREPALHYRQRSDVYVQGPLQLYVDPDGTTQVITLCGKQLIRLDLATGTPLDHTASPVTVSVRPALPPRYGDFDGDGAMDLLLVASLPDKVVQQAGGLAGQSTRLRLVAWSIAKRTQLWQLDVDAALPTQAESFLPVPDWPQVVDLDGDGACEVILPGESTTKNAWRPPWGRLLVVDGATGTVRWSQQIFNADRQLNHFVSGPDVDGDTVRDVFVASQWGLKLNLFVDCLSGADGQPLWRLEQPLLMGDHEEGWFRLGALRWSDASGDGWPQLVVPLRASNGRQTNEGASDRVVFVSAGSGTLQSIALDVSQIHFGDLDGDGTSDMLLAKQREDSDMHAGATLQAVRGTAREAWHAFLAPQVNVGDLDGDAIGDLVPESIVGSFSARSGATGKVLWHSRGLRDSAVYFARPATSLEPQQGILRPRHDLNGDGIPDFLLHRDPSQYGRELRPLLTAISGADGTRLWQSAFNAAYFQAIALVDFRDLDNDGRVEIVVVASADFGQEPHVQTGQAPFGSGHNDPQLWLAVLSAGDGSLRWSKSLCERQPTDNTRQFDFHRLWLEAAYGDLDADGNLDVILPAQRSANSDQLDMHAISGGDGSTLWKVPLLDASMGRDAFRNSLPAACGDLDGDGSIEVVTMAFGSVPGAPPNSETFRMSAYAARSGKTLWNWDANQRHNNHVVQGNAERLPDRLRPLLLKRSKGRQAIALWFDNDAPEFYVVDHQGQTLRHQKQETRDGERCNRLWAVDADEDGQDELLMADRQGLSLVSIDAFDQPLWYRARPTPAGEEVRGVLPAEDSTGRIVVATKRGDLSLRGLDVRSGQTRWTWVGPMTQDPHTEARLLNAPNASGPSLGLFQYGGRVLVRQAGASEHRDRTSDTITRPAAKAAMSAVDSRLLRPLPWKPSEHAAEGLRQAIGWTLFYAIALAAIPMLFVYWMLRRRRWGLKTMLTLPVIVSMMMLALLIQPTNPEFRSWESKLLIVLGTVPVMLSLLLLVRWWRLGKQRNIAAVAVAAIVLALLLGGVSLTVDQGRSGTLQYGERYDWDGWYYGLLPVLYWMFYLPLLGAAGMWAASQANGAIRRVMPHRFIR